MNSAAPNLSVVVPAFNESARLGRSLKTIIDYLGRYPSSEVIVVDDGSTDGTAAIAAGAHDGIDMVSVRVLGYAQNRGKGYAVRTGLLAARAPIALFTDADLSTPVTEIPKLVDPIAEGAFDLTLGSRGLDRSLIGVHQPFSREVGGRVFNLLARAATGLPLWDTQCGCKAFRMSVCRPLLEVSTVDRFGFDVEWLFIAHRAGLRLQEVPVRWDHCAGSKVRMGRDSLRMIHEISVIRRSAAAGKYDEAIHRVRAAAHAGAREWALPAVAPSA
jgi:dolichyl-phosphate beta-glucosyltransferase